MPFMSQSSTVKALKKTVKNLKTQTIECHIFDVPDSRLPDFSIRSQISKKCLKSVKCVGLNDGYATYNRFETLFYISINYAILD